MSRKHKRKGKSLIIIGILLIVAAGTLYYGNLTEDKTAGAASAVILREMDCEKGGLEGVYGEINIESLNLRLPVLLECNEYNLTQAPCRYTGSAKAGNLIIAAHNYNSHFRRLGELSYGDTIEFTEFSGVTYIYSVKEIITLDGTNVSDMQAGDWDLSLFTCTKSGKQRVTVRGEFQK